MHTATKRAFTLIELSIVLVIIGLIVGGVLVGRDLIKSAEVRAQVTQMEKLHSAVNTFRGKFNSIPGDMSASIAQQFGFTLGTYCTGGQYIRDGNGLIEGQASHITVNEPALFWMDLSSVVAGNLIEGTFPANGAAIPACTVATALTGTQLPSYFPSGKIGYSTFLYAYSNNGFNWFGLSSPSSGDGNGYLGCCGQGSPTFTDTKLPVNQAYNMDKKIDDGLPLTGNVQAIFVGSCCIPIPPANAPTDTAATCYNTNGPAYSIAFNNGNGANCAVSFKFQ